MQEIQNLSFEIFQDTEKDSEIAQKLSEKIENV